VSSISAVAEGTTGTFWLSHVGQSVIVPEFQGHPGNKALIAALSFSETR
jgi:hypothetical protein